MMGMIMVDNMGDFSHVIWPLNETEWNGLSTADLVFPSFLFIGGMSVVLAIKPESNNGWKVWLKVFKRFVILFMLGFLLNTQARI
jgi:predicted acyltransferase